MAQILEGEGDSLKGDIIAIKARKIALPLKVVTNSSNHKIMETKIRQNAFCVIERRFTSSRDFFTANPEGSGKVIQKSSKRAGKRRRKR